jgi:hypothetical protein
LQFRRTLAGFQITKFRDYQITNLLERVHGKYNEVEQRRTQKSETYRAQEAQGGQAAEAPRLSSRIEEAEGQEVGPRPGEAVGVTGSS